MPNPNRPSTDRLPPASAEAEAGVLGCVLLSPSTCLDECLEAKVAPEWFYDGRHGSIYATMLKLHEEGRAWDVLVLQQRMKDAGTLEQAGGPKYLTGLPDQVPSAANLSYYADIVREKWQMRQMIATCTEAVMKIYGHEGDVESLFAEVHSNFLRLEEASVRESELTIKALLQTKVIPKLEAHYTRGRAQITGITTGLEYLDKIFCGLGGDNGNYYVIAARPNVGKTSLVTQIGMHVAMDYRWLKEVSGDGTDGTKETDVIRTEDGKCLAWQTGLPVGISSLEMRGDSLVQKMLFQRSGADLQRWRTGYAKETDVMLITKAGSALGQANRIVIDDTPRMRIGALKAKWRRWHRQYGVRLFILDYLQLMQAEAKRFRNDRVQELAEVSAELQALGKELNCPMLVLAQMNRDYEKDPSRAPRMSDLKDCGAVEQDADAVTFLYEPRLSDTAKEFYEEVMEKKFGENWKKWDGRPQRINALVAKNRLGPKGKAELLLLHSSTTFVDWNVWLKQNHLKQAAAGEGGKYQREELPSNEDMDL